MRYYIAVASKDHVEKGVEGGFMQANHGKAASLQRLRTGDWVIFYSPKRYFEKDEKCQCFTAIGEIKDEEMYPGVMMSSDFQPFAEMCIFMSVKKRPSFLLLSNWISLLIKRNGAFLFGLVF